MKRSLPLLAVMILSLAAATAQTRLAVGDKAPEIRAKEWLPSPPPPHRAQLTEFIHPQSAPSQERLPALAKIAAENAALNVVVVSAAKTPLRKGIYTVIDEDGTVFAAYGVKIVPFGVLTDAKGRIVWFGNPATLPQNLLSEIK